MFRFNPFKSLTIAGAVGFIGTGLVAHFQPDALSMTAETVLQAGAGLISMLGLRNAVAKALAGTLAKLADKTR